MWLLIALFAVGYMLGNLNLSILVTRLVGGYDIRTRGSGNAGGTNVARNLGTGWGVLVIVCEIVKSAGFGLLAKYVFPAGFEPFGAVGATFCGVIAIAGCLVGNTFPVFHGFKGGKGVTAGAALSIVIDYRVFLVILGVFLVFMLFSRTVSLGSVMSAVALSIGTFVLMFRQPYGWFIIAVTALCCALIVFNHRSNIGRLARGCENKISFLK